MESYQGFDGKLAGFWVRRLHGNSAGRIHICSSANWSGRLFPAGDVEGAVSYITELEHHEVSGIYLRATTIRDDAIIPAGQERGKVSDSLSLPGLWADIDLTGPGHRHTPNRPDLPGYDEKRRILHPLPVDAEVATGILRGSGIPQPTLWIHSGGGLYPWWLLDQPVDLAGDEAELAAAQSISAAWQRMVGYTFETCQAHYGTGVGDLARVLRIPGTVNRKAGLQRPCRPYTEEPMGPVYTWDALERFVCDLEPGLEERAIQARKAWAAPTRSQRMHTPSSPKPEHALTEDTPLNDFERTRGWEDILLPAGWTIHHSGSDGTVYWTRPGKEVRDGFSATTGHANDRDRMYCFSDAAGLPVNEPMTKGFVYAELHHVGDLSAAASSLRSQGLGGESSAPSGSWSSWRGSLQAAVKGNPDVVARDQQIETIRQQALAGAAVPERQAVADDFEKARFDAIARESKRLAEHPSIEDLEIVPFEPVGPSPKFPTQVFPGPIAAMVDALASELRVPTDLPAMLVLSNLAAAAGPRIAVQGKRGWFEPLNFYGICAMVTGSRKSPTFRPFLDLLGRCIDDATVSKRTRLTGEHQKMSRELSDLEARVEHDDKTGIGGRLAKAGVKALDKKLNQLEDVIFSDSHMFRGGNVTPEALEVACHQNEGWMNLIDHEGSLLRNLGGQYTGGQIANLDLILKGYDGDRFTVNRLHRDSLSIPRPVLTLMMAAQPEVVLTAYRTQLMDSTGFLHRFICAVPDPVIDNRPITNDVDSVNVARVDRGMSALEDLMHRIISGHPVIDPDNRNSDPGSALTLEQAAFDMFSECELTVRFHMREGMLREHQEWAAKYSGRLLRTAGLLHLLHGLDASTPISRQTMMAACEVMRWAGNHQLRMLKALSEANRIEGRMSEDAQRIAEFLDGQQEPVKRATIRVEVFRRHCTKERMEAALSELQASGLYIRSVVRIPARRPTEMWHRAQEAAP